nr:hypothetical protein [Gordonia sp. 'Campus']
MDEVVAKPVREPGYRGSGVDGTAADVEHRLTVVLREHRQDLQKRRGVERYDFHAGAFENRVSIGDRAAQCDGTVGGDQWGWGA